MASPTTADLLGVSGSGSTFAIAVSATGQILRWDGTSWTIQTTTSNLLRAVWVESPTSAVAVDWTRAAMKLMGTLLVQEFSETGVELLGPYGVLMNDSRAPFEGKWAKQMLGDRSMTIAGGTSEVQRNIVAQRVLGLPRR